ncbi:MULTISPECIES: hypothetical protein [unclassified Pseudomonas]|uniref:hypothetical protein n=1 Tax=unclassified Pseudomonas TaxID=196821 RepID=UPI000837F0F1|nr:MULTISPECIES: hypothetical protein [unclassified Pseudomonas]QIH09766.1 hypothetical protein ATY02_25155 [Pseudomonas sp. BIOMIG1BAC]
MNHLPLIDLYPISDDPPSPREVSLYQAALQNGWPTRPLREQQTVSDARELVIHTLHNYSLSGIISELRRQLNAHPHLRQAKSEMPYLKDSEPLRQYQKGLDKFPLATLNDEVRRHGKLLAPRQVLFHGGSCGPADVRSFVTNRPLSTSLCPQIAAWHAYNDQLPNTNPTPAIWILNAPYGNKKAVIYRKGGAGMENEQEVLIESGATISPWRQFNVRTSSANVLVIEAILT